MAEDQLPPRSRAVQRHLTEAGVRARVRELPESTRTAAQAAAALGCEVGAIASSLVFLADGSPLLVMTSGRHRVDVEFLAERLGVTDLRMAGAARVKELTGQAIGGVAPVGHPEPLRAVVDETLGEHDPVWAAGGTPRTIVPLAFGELVSLTGGTTLPVARD